MTSINNIPYTFYRYAVMKNSWNKLIVKIHPSTKYKKGSIRITNGVDKSPIMPEVRLPNIIFTGNKKASSIEEMENYDNFEICFFSDNCPMIHIYATNLKIVSIGLREIKPMALKREVDLWKLRRQFDLEFLNYYLEKNFIDFNPPDFIDRFTAEFKLFKNPNYLNNFAQQLSLNLPTIPPTEEHKILYLIQLSVQYESSAYAIRTQKLLNEANQLDEKYQIHAVTRYGYPYDREDEYYVNKELINNIDHVSYIKLTNRTDNFNDNNLIEYLKKYIIETIKLAHSTGAKIIHGCNNFYNGIATIYAAKYLNLKSIYEVRSLWEYDHRPDVYDSDVLHMRRSMEDLVIQKADLIITVNQDLKKQLIDRGVEPDKIQIVSNGLNTDYVPTEAETKKQLQDGIGVSNWDLTIGYVGDATPKLCDLLIKIREIKAELGLTAGLIVIGNGEARMELYQFVQDNDLIENYKAFEPMDDGKLPKYIDLFDLAFYPEYDYGLLKVLAQGVPTIAYPTEKNKEVIQGGINGVLTDEGRLIEMIGSVYKDNKLKARLNEGAKDYINKFFGWKEPAESLVKIYETLLS